MRVLVSFAIASALVFSSQSALAQKQREISVGLQAAITSMDPHYHNLSPNNSSYRHCV